MTKDCVNPSDMGILDLLCTRDEMAVSDFTQALGVTATAVRQRIVRLQAQGLVDRVTERQQRGRPRHVYRLTERGRRRTGENFADLAVVLWNEIRSITDQGIRQGLLARVARRLANLYAGELAGKTISDKMRSLASLFQDRQIPFDVDRSGELPILTAHACPYPQLAEKDRSICAMEKLMFSELLGESVRLTQCRLDGQSCCKFELN